MVYASQQEYPIVSTWCVMLAELQMSKAVKLSCGGDGSPERIVGKLEGGDSLKVGGSLSGTTCKRVVISLLYPQTPFDLQR